MKRFELTNEDKELLRRWGYPDDDFNQIETATKYGEITNGDKKRISIKEAIKILGRENFLSGISRASFHWTSTLANDDGERVCFDFSNYFE